MQKIIEDHSIKLILFDCDGVFFDNHKPISGTLEVLDKLYERGDLEIAYLTNNTTKRRETLVERFDKYGLKHQLPLEKFYATAYLAGQYIKQ